MRPNDVPFLHVQCGPSGPATTYGMRSFIAAVAFLVKRSSGIHGMSMWQSADIRRYVVILSGSSGHVDGDPGHEVGVARRQEADDARLVDGLGHAAQRHALDLLLLLLGRHLVPARAQA